MMVTRARIIDPAKVRIKLAETKHRELISRWVREFVSEKGWDPKHADDYFSNDYQRNKHFIAFEGDVPIGVIGINATPGEYVYGDNRGAKSTFGHRVEWIYVPPEHRRRGIDRLLAGHVEKDVKQVNGRRILASAVDPRAANLLKKRGYKFLGESMAEADGPKLLRVISGDLFAKEL